MIIPKRKPPFLGAASACATPFCEEGLDLPSLRLMIDTQIAKGINGILLCGTTGEAATLTEREYETLLTLGAEYVGGRVPYLVGCGSADTQKAAARARLAARVGADAILVVTPYYNKGTAEGIRRHYETVAEAAGLPTVLYHVPGRTGVRLSADAICRIAEHPLIVGIKEASGDMELFALLSERLADTLTLYTGCDALILPSLALGGGGVISVISNLLPKETAALCTAFFEGRSEEALGIAQRLAPLIRLLFAETNPAPLKCALALQGVCEERLRLPLSPVSAELRAQLYDALRAAKV